MNNALTASPGSLVCAMRIYMNLSQQQLAQSLGIPESALARIEANEQVPTLDMWCMIMNHFGLSIDSSRYGMIDFESIISIRSGVKENGFVLPLRYSQKKCITVREILPLFNFTAHRCGEKTLMKIIEDLHLSPMFFHILDNQINVFFLADFLEKLRTHTQLPNTEYQTVAEFFAKEEPHGTLSRFYKQCRTEKELVQAYLSKLDQYERIFKYDLEPITRDNALLVHVNYNSDELEDDLFEVGTDTQIFLDEYREAKIKRLVNFPVNHKINSDQFVSLSEISSLYRGDSETVYKVQFSA